MRVAKLHRSVRGVLALAMLLVGVVPAESGHAAGTTEPYARYSIAAETGYTNLYTGGSVTRVDSSFTIPDCTDPNTKYLESINQTLWLIMPSNTGFLETGTGHECKGRRYWYGFVCGRVGCGWLYTTPFAVSSTHTFQIRRRAGTTDWEIRRDGSLISTIHWGNTSRASHIHTELEVHAPTAKASLHKYSNLKYSVYDGGMSSWAGFDNKGVGSPACGGWNSATEWRAAFRATC